MKLNFRGRKINLTLYVVETPSHNVNAPEELAFWCGKVYLMHTTVAD